MRVGISGVQALKRLGDIFEERRPLYVPADARVCVEGRGPRGGWGVRSSTLGFMKGRLPNMRAIGGGDKKGTRLLQTSEGLRAKTMGERSERLFWVAVSSDENVGTGEQLCDVSIPFERMELRTLLSRDWKVPAGRGQE